MTIYKMNAAFVQSGRWFFPEAYCVTDDKQQAFDYFTKLIPTLYPDVKIISRAFEVKNEDLDRPVIIHQEPYPIDRLFATDLNPAEKLRTLVAFKLELDTMEAQG